MSNNIREIIADSPLAAETKKVLSQWVQYRIGEGETYNRTKIDALIAAAAMGEKEYGAMAVVSIVSDCIVNNGKILFWDRLSRFPKQTAAEQETNVSSIAVSRETYEYTKDVYKLVSGREWHEH